MIFSFIDAISGNVRYSKPTASSANIVRYHILLKTSEWYKNISGNAWYSLSKTDAEYQLKLLRKKGLV